MFFKVGTKIIKAVKGRQGNSLYLSNKTDLYGRFDFRNRSQGLYSLLSE